MDMSFLPLVQQCPHLPCKPIYHALFFSSERLSKHCTVGTSKTCPRLPCTPFIVQFSLPPKKPGKWRHYCNLLNLKIHFTFLKMRLNALEYAHSVNLKPRRLQNLEDGQASPFSLFLQPILTTVHVINFPLDAKAATRNSPRSPTVHFTHPSP